MLTLLPFVFFAILITIAIKSWRTGLFIAVFLAPWQGLDADVGLRITAYRLAIIALVVVVGFKRYRISYIRPNPWLWSFILYAICWSCFQIFWLPMSNVAGREKALLGLLRPIANIYVWNVYRPYLFCTTHNQAT